LVATDGTPTSPDVTVEIWGLAGADNIIGSSTNDTIYGGAGNDIINGNGGDLDLVMDAETGDTLSNCMSRLWHFDTTIGNNRRADLNTLRNSSTFADTLVAVGTTANPDVTPLNTMRINGVKITTPYENGNPNVNHIFDEIDDANILGITPCVVDGKLMIMGNSTTDVILFDKVGSDTGGLLKELGLPPSKFYRPARRKAKNGHQFLDLNNTFGPDHELVIPQGYISPIIDSTGGIETFSRLFPSDVGEKHCMFCVSNDQLKHAGTGGVPYLRNNVRYRIEFTANFSSEVNDMLWCIPIQVHPGTFPFRWVKNWVKDTAYEQNRRVQYEVGSIWKQYEAKRNVLDTAKIPPQNAADWRHLRDGDSEFNISPPLALYVQSNIWTLAVRGGSDDKYEYKKEMPDTTVVFTPGVHNIVIDFKCNYVGSPGENGTGNVTCSVDGVTIATVTGKKIGCKPNFNSNPPPTVPLVGQLTAGVYGPPNGSSGVALRGSEPTITFTNFSFYEEN